MNQAERWPAVVARSHCFPARAAIPAIEFRAEPNQDGLESLSQASLNPVSFGIRVIVVLLSGRFDVFVL